MSSGILQLMKTSTHIEQIHTSGTQPARRRGRLIYSSCSFQDVVSSLRDKLCISAVEHFSLVLEHVKSLKRNKLTLLDADETLARVSILHVYNRTKFLKTHDGLKQGAPP